MLQAVVITLPKQCKEPDHPKTFKPISLLNTDLKVYAKIVFNRLADVIPSLIKEDQLGFVKGRQDHNGTWRMFDHLKVVEDHC